MVQYTACLYYIVRIVQYNTLRITDRSFFFADKQARFVMNSERKKDQKL